MSRFAKALAVVALCVALAASEAAAGRIKRAWGKAKQKVLRRKPENERAPLVRPKDERAGYDGPQAQSVPVQQQQPLEEQPPHVPVGTLVSLEEPLQTQPLGRRQPLVEWDAKPLVEEPVNTSAPKGAVENQPKKVPQEERSLKKNFKPRSLTRRGSTGDLTTLSPEDWLKKQKRKRAFGVPNDEDKAETAQDFEKYLPEYLEEKKNI